MEWFHNEDQNRVSGWFRAFGEVFGGIDTAENSKKKLDPWKCQIAIGNAIVLFKNLKKNQLLEGNSNRFLGLWKCHNSIWNALLMLNINFC